MRVRILMWALCAIPIVFADLAHAGFPLAMRWGGGPGLGTGHENGFGLSGVGGMIAADLELRPRPGRAWVASACLGGAGRTGKRLLWSASPDWLSFGSVAIGVQRSHPVHATTTFTQAGVGLGRVGAGETAMVEPLQSDGRVRGGFGPALDAAIGYRLAPDPGPVGFVFEIRTHHVIAARRSVHLLALMLGLTIYPR